MTGPQPTNAQLLEHLERLQQQVSQLTTLVCSHNGVTAVDELQIAQVAKDFNKRGVESIREWNKAKKARGRRRAG